MLRCYHDGYIVDAPIGSCAQMELTATLDSLTDAVKANKDQSVRASLEKDYDRRSADKEVQGLRAKLAAAENAVKTCVANTIVSSVDV